MYVFSIALVQAVGENAKKSVRSVFKQKYISVNRAKFIFKLELFNFIIYVNVYVKLDQWFMNFQNCKLTFNYALAFHFLILRLCGKCNYQVL